MTHISSDILEWTGSGMGMRQQKNGNGAGSLIDVSREDMEVLVR